MIFDKEAYRFMIKDEILSGKLSSDPEDISTYIDKTASDVVKYLVEHGIKIAVAESCTGGMVTAAITSVAGASEVFDGGVCSYANAVKAGLLGVSEETARQDACKIEHDLSDETFEAIRRHLENIESQK